MKQTFVWAHRGASAYAPENTLEAFQLAIDMGADGIELDVQLTADDQVVVLHDETIDRVSNGQGYVKDYTLKQLKEYRFNKLHPEFSNAVIPTLEEVLKLLQPTRLVLNIELKTGVFFYPGLEEKVIALVEKYHMQNRVWYSSFNHYSVRKIRELRADAKTGILYTDGIYQPAVYANNMGVDAIHPYYNNLKYPALLDDCHKSGIEIHTWTVNCSKDIIMCYKKHIDAIITNYPDKAVLLGELNGEGKAIYENPFAADRNRAFYLFGAGNLGREFIDNYSSCYMPIKILDNDSDKWGKEYHDITIDCPDNLRQGDCVVIANEYFPEIIGQLRKMGIVNYYVYCGLYL